LVCFLFGVCCGKLSIFINTFHRKIFQRKVNKNNAFCCQKWRCEEKYQLANNKLVTEGFTLFYKFLLRKNCCLLWASLNRKHIDTSTSFFFPSFQNSKENKIIPCRMIWWLTDRVKRQETTLVNIINTYIIYQNALLYDGF